jgi:hypothetical protein
MGSHIAYSSFEVRFPEITWNCIATRSLAQRAANRSGRSDYEIVEVVKTRPALASELV